MTGQVIGVDGGLAMAGLIWFVQLVHYPLMARVGRREFRAYHEDHVRRTGWIVVPRRGALERCSRSG